MASNFMDRDIGSHAPCSKGAGRGCVQPPRAKVGPVTNLRRWRLTSVLGRQTWAYAGEEEEEEEAEGKEQSFAELHSLGLDTVGSISQ